MRLIVAILAAVAAHALVAAGRRIHVPVPTFAAAGLGFAVWLLSATAEVPTPLSIVAGLAGMSAPGLIGRMRRRRAASDAREQWPDLLAVVRSRIGSGEPLPDAVRAAARTLGGSFLDLDRAWGGAFVSELEAARLRWADPVADRVLITLRVAAATGGTHVDAVLSSLAISLADEMRIRSAHQAALTQQRLTAGVALVAPWAILALSIATNPQAAAEFSSPTGRLILAGGLIATVGGFLLARRASRLSSPPRVFA